MMFAVQIGMDIFLAIFVIEFFFSKEIRGKAFDLVEAVLSKFTTFFN